MLSDKMYKKARHLGIAMASKQKHPWPHDKCPQFSEEQMHLVAEIVAECLAKSSSNRREIEFTFKRAYWGIE